MNEAYVIYDEANGNYLAGGSARSLVVERTENALLAHTYKDEKTAKMMCNRLWQTLRKRTWADISYGYIRDCTPNEPVLTVARLSNPSVDLITE